MVNSRVVAYTEAEVHFSSASSCTMLGFSRV